MAKVLSSINGLSRCSSSSSSSSYYRPMVVKMGQTQSYWASIESDIEAHLKKNISIRPPESVFEPMHYLTFTTPKSTAPSLCIAACELVGGDRAHAMDAASAIHLMHVATYTHQHMQMASEPESVLGLLSPDGVIPFGAELQAEEISLARNNPDKINEPAIAHKFGPNNELLTPDGITSLGVELQAKALGPARKNYDKNLSVTRPELEPGIQHKFSPNIELLTGDGIMPLAIELLAKCMSPARENSDKILRVITEVTRSFGSQGLLEGQYCELEWARSGHENEELLEYVCKKKEGEIHACGAACGAILGDGNDEEVERLRNYGLYVGMIKGIILMNGSKGRNYNKKRMEKRVEELRVLAMKELDTSFKGNNKLMLKSIASLIEEI